MSDGHREAIEDVRFASRVVRVDGSDQRLGSSRTVDTRERQDHRGPVGVRHVELDDRGVVADVHRVDEVDDGLPHHRDVRIDDRGAVVHREHDRHVLARILRGRLRKRRCRHRDAVHEHREVRRREARDGITVRVGHRHERLDRVRDGLCLDAQCNVRACRLHEEQGDEAEHDQRPMQQRLHARRRLRPA